MRVRRLQSVDRIFDRHVWKIFPADREIRDVKKVDSVGETEAGNLVCLRY